MSAPFTMYSTPWCGYCLRLKSQLDREGIAFDEVDIEQYPEAAHLVEQINDGNQTVPTLVFADGTAMTNPSLIQVGRSSPASPPDGLTSQAAASPGAGQLPAVPVLHQRPADRHAAGQHQGPRPRACAPARPG